MQVVDELLNCWRQTGIETVSSQSVHRLLLKAWKKYRLILKDSSRFNSTKKRAVGLYKLECTQLFDIAKCKCVDFCNCTSNSKIPEKIFDFLIDQRTSRIKTFCPSWKLEKNIETAVPTPSSSSSPQSDNNSESQQDEIDLDEIDEDVDSSVDNDSEDDQWEPRPKPKRQRIKLKASAMICERYGIANRAGAALVTAVLEDIGVVTPDDKRLVVDHHKLKRARNSCRKMLRENKNVTKFPGLFIDGRKDRTLKATVKGNVRYTSVVKEEHFSVLAEPGGEYIGHVSVASGSASAITGEIFDYLNRENIPKDFDAVGCDSTNVNTGWENGIIRSIETCLQRPLQWLICLLHLNELPLRHLLQRLDGPTTGPNAFKGPIGRGLKNSTKLPLAKFKKIPCKLPTLPNDISTDQKYLYNICTAISTGKCSDRLAQMHPGNICHSRWLTIANHILRTYVGTARPSKVLVTLTTFIIKVYAPNWFAIKTMPNCYNGAVIYHKFLTSTRYLPVYLKKIVDPVLRRNCYYAHPENILIAMLCDSRENVRKLAVERIVAARAKKPKKSRVFRVPPINLSANDYTQMIDWEKVLITEPPITTKFSKSELESVYERKKDIKSFNLPCHTQAVERCVKVNTSIFYLSSLKQLYDYSWLQKPH